MREIFKSAFAITKKHALILIGVMLSIFIVSMIFSFITQAFIGVPVVGFVFNIISIIFQIYIGVGLVKLGLCIVDGKEPEFADVKPNGTEMIKYLMSGLMLVIIFLVVFMMTIGVLGMLDVMKPGLNTLYLDFLKQEYSRVYTQKEIFYAVMVFLLLTIPASLLYLRLQFSNYLVIDKKMEVGSAIIHSYRMTKGYLFYIVLFMLVIVVINIVGLLMLFVGLLFTIPMSFIAVVLLYRSLEHNYQINILETISKE